VDSNSFIMSNPFAEPDNEHEKTWFDCWAEMQKQIPTDAMKTVTVDPPEEQNKLLRKHLVYPVRTRFVTKRAYADFQWLFDTLSSRYIGMFVPAVPAKYPASTATGGKDIFFANRHVQLGIWLNSILANPYLCQDSAVIAFLTVQDEKEWKQAQLEAKDLTLFTDTTMGTESWRSILRWAPSVPNATDAIETMHEKMVDLLAATSKIRDGLLRVCSTSGKLYTDMSDVKDSEDAWRGKEQHVEHTDILPNPASCGTQAMGISIGAVALCCAGSLTNVTALNRINVTIVLPSIMHQISMIEGAITMIKNWEKAKADIDVSQKQIESLVGKKDRVIDFQQGRRPSIFGRFENSTTNMEKVDSDINNKEEELKQLRRLYDMRERAITTSEIERFFVERAQRLASLASQVLAANKALEATLTENCKKVVAQYAIETTSFDGKMTGIFDEAELKVQAVFLSDGPEDDK